MTGEFEWVEEAEDRDDRDGDDVAASYIRYEEEQGGNQAQESENTAGDGAGTSAPADSENTDVRTQSYHDERLSCIASGRTDLRSLDQHASWREVASACHVEPGR